MKKGATVICNEKEKKQLEYICHIKSINSEEKKRLYLKHGSILEIDFPENSIGAIHISRVMHFFNPNEVELFFKMHINGLNLMEEYILSLCLNIIMQILKDLQIIIIMK